MELSLCDADVRKLIDAGIQKAIIEALGVNKEELIGKLVDQALSAKDVRYGNRETLFETEVHKMIREAAVEAFREWTAANKEVFKTAVQRAIKQRLPGNNFAEMLTERFMEGLAKSFYVSVNMKVED